MFVEGENVVECEGIMFKYLCKLFLIVMFNLEEGNFREYLLDRIAVTFSAD